MSAARKPARVLQLGLMLALALPCARVFAQADDELGSLDDDDTSAKKKKQAPDAADSEPAESPEPDAPAPAQGGAADTADHGPSVSVQPFAGAGWSTRSFQRPTKLGGGQTLDASVIPAVEVGLRVLAWPTADFSLIFGVHYQTGLGLIITETPPFALENKVHARSERVEVTIAPSWRVGSFRLTVPLGGSMRTLWPGVHTLLTPGYSLVGPLARVELSGRLAGPIGLSLGPEVQWITLIDSALRAEGVRNQGLAFGAEVTLSVELSLVWSLALNYRESHALVSSYRGPGFEDVERYMTLRAQGSF
jgi:hypothetical protein